MVRVGRKTGTDKRHLNELSPRSAAADATFASAESGPASELPPLKSNDSRNAPFPLAPSSKSFVKPVNRVAGVCEDRNAAVRGHRSDQYAHQPRASRRRILRFIDNQMAGRCPVVIENVVSGLQQSDCLLDIFFERGPQVFEVGSRSITEIPGQTVESCNADRQHGRIIAAEEQDTVSQFSDASSREAEHHDCRGRDSTRCKPCRAQATAVLPVPGPASTSCRAFVSFNDSPLMFRPVQHHATFGRLADLSECAAARRTAFTA